MITYYGYVLSPNQIETGEGFLICKNVPLARIGDMDYFASELKLDGDPERQVIVHRYPEDVFDPAAIASFEGKPLTDGHPPEDVTPETFGAYAKGHAQNIRREGDLLVGDLYVNDAQLISDITNKVKYEISCGYCCRYEPDGDGYKQIQIRGNHIAVVPKGRAGSMISIKDEKPKKERSIKMSDFGKSVLKMFSAAVKDADPTEVEQMTDVAAAALSSDACNSSTGGVQDEVVYKEQKGVDLGSKMDELLMLMRELVKKNDIDKKLMGEDALDAVIAGEKDPMEKEASKTIPADEMNDACSTMTNRDTGIEVLKAIRPFISKIDEAERTKAVDAMLTAYRGAGTNQMNNILNATKDAAKNQQLKKPSFEQVCDEQKKIYDKFNPHKKGADK